MSIKELFITLVKIPSPSGHEQGVSKWVAGYLNKLGVDFEIIEGNVVAQIPGDGPSIVLVAHMDTVQKVGDKIVPIWNGTGFKSGGKTILGADNKAGVAVLLSLIKDLTGLKAKPKVIAAFTTKEEAGKMGSWLIPISKYKPTLILNVDGGKSVGTIDVKALGQVVFEIEVIGKAAHASLNPEKGIHAIKIAAEIITKINIGRRAGGDVVNIGFISGGGATNVVTEQTLLRGELRSFTKAGLQKMQNSLKNLCKMQEFKHGAKVIYKELPEVGMPVWEETKSVKWLTVFKKAAKKADVKFKTSVMYASSDANPLSKHGVATYSINRGGKNPHSFSESITLAEMKKAKSFIMEILKLCYPLSRR